jgi:hypothetical protein
MGRNAGKDLNRRSFIEGCFVTAAALASGGLSRVLAAQSAHPWEFQPDRLIIPAPEDPALWPSYRGQRTPTRDIRRTS